MNARRDIQRERLFYIDFLALFTGQVGRKDLVSRFGISEPAATKDLSLYAELAPGVLNYDLRQKRYIFSGKETYFSHNAEQALYSLSGERAIAFDTEHAKRLPSWISSSIKRKVPVPLVAAITRAMYQHRKMTASYVSLSSGHRERILSPLALVNDGLRWHIRCFAHDRDEFRDYNLARFVEVKEGDTSEYRLENDTDWNTEVCLKLVPHPKAKYSETIRMDYGIEDDAKYVTLKTCLVGYFLRHWHIDFTDDASGNPRAQQLYLQNKSDLLKQGVSEWAFEL